MPLLGARGGGSNKGFGFGAGSSVITFVSLATATHGSATSITINKPATVSAGNLLVAFICHADTDYTQRFSSIPSGWTLGSLQSTVNARGGSLLAYYKIAGASEPASYTWSNASVSRNGTGVILNYSNAVWDASSKSLGLQSSPLVTLIPDPSSITVAKSNSILFFVVGGEDPNTTVSAPSGYLTSISRLGGSSQGGAIWLFVKLDVPAGNSGTPSTTMATGGQAYVLLSSINPA